MIAVHSTMDLLEAQMLALGQPTNCPICGIRVNKPTKSDEERRNMIVCENEYYVHFVNRKGHNILQQFITPRTSPDEIRFKTQEELKIKIDVPADGQV